MSFFFIYDIVFHRMYLKIMFSFYFLQSMILKEISLDTILSLDTNSLQIEPFHTTRTKSRYQFLDSTAILLINC